MNSLKQILESNLYSERDLVDFGNYVLSSDRQENIQSDPTVVYDPDLQNWKYKNKMKSLVQHVQEALTEAKTNDIVYSIKGGSNSSAYVDAVVMLDKLNIKYELRAKHDDLIISQKDVDSLSKTDRAMFDKAFMWDKSASWELHESYESDMSKMFKSENIAFKKAIDDKKAEDICNFVNAENKTSLNKNYFIGTTFAELPYDVMPAIKKYLKTNKYL